MHIVGFQGCYPYLTFLFLVMMSLDLQLLQMCLLLCTETDLTTRYERVKYRTQIRGP